MTPTSTLPPLEDTARKLREVMARLEAATKRSAVINREIWKLIGLTPAQEAHCAQWCRMDGRTDLTREQYIAAWAPDFTGSVDAALTLVPEEWTAWELSSKANKTQFRAELSRLVGLNSENEDFEDGWSATPALALCIAALKARIPASSGKGE